MTTYTIPNPYAPASFTATTGVQDSLTRQILAAAAVAGASAQQFPPPVISTRPAPAADYQATLTAPFAFNLFHDSLTGSASIPSAQVLLANDTSYVTGGTSVSTVVSADGANSTVVNNNVAGALLAVGGAANGQFGDTFEGLAGGNQFITGIGGRDAVLLDGSVNNLTSNGNDVVLVGGPSTITAAPGGTDAVTMVGGTTLAFINQSASTIVDSIGGAANGIVLLAGTGNTSITAGTGAEFFFVDTSAGNTTLNANANPNAAFTFIKDLPTSTAAILVNNFVAGDVVAIHGYTGFTVQVVPTGGSVLSLSDGAKITFSNLAPAALQQTIRNV